MDKKIVELTFFPPPKCKGVLAVSDFNCHEGQNSSAEFFL